MSVAFFALDHAMESVVASGGPLVPFAVVTGSGGISQGDVSIARFPGDMERGQEEARKHVSDSGASTAAVAWDGFLTVEGKRSDAVFVEAFEVGDSESVVLAQRYASSGLLRKKVGPVGNATLVARRSTLL